MSRLMITSDLHLGHKSICKYRTEFSTEEEHSETLFENLASSIKKADTIYFLGDIAFTKGWLEKIKSLRCRYKLLICGNHDTERGISMRDLVDCYDNVMSLYSKRNYWFTHCPIHPSEIRGREGVIHGHLHDKVIDDGRYFNACVEHTKYKPISFGDLTKGDHGGNK